MCTEASPCTVVSETLIRTDNFLLGELENIYIYQPYFQVQTQEGKLSLTWAKTCETPWQRHKELCCLIGFFSAFNWMSLSICRRPNLLTCQNSSKLMSWSGTVSLQLAGDEVQVDFYGRKLKWTLRAPQSWFLFVSRHNNTHDETRWVKFFPWNWWNSPSNWNKYGNIWHFIQLYFTAL